jgi:hypothetical protein
VFVLEVSQYHHAVLGGFLDCPLRFSERDYRFLVNESKNQIESGKADDPPAAAWCSDFIPKLPQ